MTAPTPIQRWHLDIVRHWMVTEPDGQYVLYDDHLAAMAAASAASVAAPRWIPVSERMPEENVDVLVYGFPGYSGKPVVMQSRMMLADVGNSPIWLGYHLVTHWMPLPQPPKETTP